MVLGTEAERAQGQRLVVAVAQHDDRKPVGASVTGQKEVEGPRFAGADVDEGRVEIAVAQPLAGVTRPNQSDLEAETAHPGEKLLDAQLVQGISGNHQQ